MIKDYIVLGIIPARGGSKGIPCKNVKLLAGKPLLVYTLENLRDSKYIDRSIVITDDDEIAKLAKDYEVEQPFIEPDDLADGSHVDYDFFRYALEWLQKNESYQPDIIVQLRATSPLRTTEEVDKAIELLVEHLEADSVRTVTEPSQSPYKTYGVDEAGYLQPLLPLSEFKESFNMPRQKLPKAYKHVGYIDVIWWKTIMEKNMMTGKKIFPMVIPNAVSGINNPEDWDYYEYLINKNK